MVPGISVTSAKDTNRAVDSFWDGLLYKISNSEKQANRLTLKELVEYTRFATASLCVKNTGDIPAMSQLS